MPQYLKFYKEGVTLNRKKKSTAGRKGGAVGGFRNRLYKFGKTAGDVNAVVQSQFIKNARRSAYTYARGGGFVAAATSGDFRKKYGSAQSLALRGARVGVGRLSGMAINQVVPRSLGPVLGRLARRELGGYISKSPMYQMANRKIESKLTGFFNSDAVPHYQHVVTNMNIQEVLDLQIERTAQLIRASAPDISSGQYMLGVGASELGLNIKDTRLRQDQYDEEAGMSFDENYKLKTLKGYTNTGTKKNPVISKEYVEMDIFGFTEPGKARELLLKSVQTNRAKVPKAKKGKMGQQIFTGDVRVGTSRKNGVTADLFPWIWLVEYGGPITQQVSSWSRKDNKPVVKDVKKYIPPTLFVTRSVQAVNNMKFNGAKVKVHMKAPRVGGVKNPVELMNNILSEKGRYQQMIKKKGLAIEKDGRISYKPKSLLAAMNRKGTGRHFSQGIKRENVAGRNRRFYKYNKKHDIAGVKVHNTHGVSYSQELQDAIGVKFAPDSITATVNFKNVGKIKGGVSAREKFLTSILTDKNPSKTRGGASRAGLLNNVELFGEQSSKQAFNATQASDFVDFDTFAVSGDTGFGKISGKRLSSYISKNYNVSVRRGSKGSGSGAYEVTFTRKNKGTKSAGSKRSQSVSDKRFASGAKRPGVKQNKFQQKAARAMVENANYEEIISAASFFYNSEDEV